MSVRFFSGERFICEQKDLDRAKSCTSEAKAMAQLNAITDLDKLFRRGIAFATVGQYGTDPKPWMDKAKQLGASNEDVQRFYQELIKAGKIIDPTNEDMLMAALAMLAAGKAAQQSVSEEDKQVVKPVEEPTEDAIVVQEVAPPESAVIAELAEPEPVTGEGKRFSVRMRLGDHTTRNVLSESGLLGLLDDISTLANAGYGPDRSSLIADLRKKYATAMSEDFTIKLGLANNLEEFDYKDVDIKTLKFGVVQLGWDYWVNLLTETIEKLDGSDYMTDDEFSSHYNTIKFSSYYNDFANQVSASLEEIYGGAQECYAGFSFNNSFISGYDVNGGSVILAIRCTNGGDNYKIEVDKGQILESYGSNDQMLALFRPHSFYGVGSDHFFDTSGSGCKYAELNLRLD